MYYLFLQCSHFQLFELFLKRRNFSVKMFPPHALICIPFVPDRETVLLVDRSLLSKFHCVRNKALLSRFVVCVIT